MILTFVLAALSGALGCIAGSITSFASFEELQKGQRYFKWWRNATMIAASTFLALHWSVYVALGILIVGSLVLFFVHEKVFFFLPPVLFSVIFLFANWSDSYELTILSALFFSTGLAHSSMLAVKYASLRKKPFSFVATIVKSMWPYWTIPWISVLLLVVL